MKDVDGTEVSMPSVASGKDRHGDIPFVIQQIHHLTVATWNIRSLHESVKLENAVHEMK